MLVDDPIVQAALSRLVARHGDCVAVATLREAIEQVRLSDWCAVLSDLLLPDGSGLDAIERLRWASPETPAMILSAHRDSEAILRANELRAEYHLKPAPTERIDCFVRAAALRSSPSLPARVERVIVASADAWEVSRAEIEVAVLAICGATDDEIAARRHARVETVRLQRGSFLTKTRMGSMTDLVGKILRAADALRDGYAS